jgi:hypothetical protein
MPLLPRPVRVCANDAEIEIATGVNAGLSLVRVDAQFGQTVKLMGKGHPIAGHAQQNRPYPPVSFALRLVNAQGRLPPAFRRIHAQMISCVRKELLVAKIGRWLNQIRTFRPAIL